MHEIMLEAETRALIGKGASRRLRRLDDKVPAVLYGGNLPSQTIQFLQKHVQKSLEIERIYSSVFEIVVDGKKERVILKDIQRHPYKALVLHMDLQRVSAKDVLVRTVPLHFVNEAISPGVKACGIVNHTMTEVEVRCEARYLPEFIEVDLVDLEMDQVLHLSALKLPEGVALSFDPTKGDHDHPVVSIHEPRVIVEEEVVEEIVEAAAEADEAEQAAQVAKAEDKPAAE